MAPTGALLAAAVAILAAGAPAIAGSATYYVDRMSPACSNSGAGSEAGPYCTITAAVNARGAAGNTILVKPGVYPEQVTINASGVEGDPIVIQAAGSGVVLEGADDFSDPDEWKEHSGDVWLADDVTWNPNQVFSDGERLAASTAAPDSLSPGSFAWVSGAGLYVNVGGGNPGSLEIRVSRRNHGFSLFGRSWITIDGFTMTRTRDRGIYINGSCSNITATRNTVTFAFRIGIQVSGGSGMQIGSNTISDCSDHGISLTNVTASTIEDNESCRNALPSARAANGIYLFACPGNLLRRNRVHHNQDSGIHLQSGSNDCVLYLNRSWSNGDHGYDHLGATGAIHANDVAFGNLRDGFSIEGNATGTQIRNCILAENGLTTGRYNLWVEGGSATGFASNHNIIWNSTSQPPIRYVDFYAYATVAAYSAASGQDAQSLQTDPLFVDAAAGDFRPRPGSPAIDSGDSGAPYWPDTDAAGNPCQDDWATPNAGIGPIPFSDRGALEFVPADLPPSDCVNLVGDPSFEADTEGWRSVGATIERVPGGSDGAYACRVTGEAEVATFGLEDAPNWIAGAAVGSTYRCSAWFRSDSARGIAGIRVREYLNGVRIGEIHSPGLELSPAWQRLEVEYAVKGKGSIVDVLVRNTPVSPSEAFDVDDISICAVPTRPAPTPRAAVAALPPSAAPGSGAPVPAGAAPPVVAPNPVTFESSLRFSTTRPGPLKVSVFDIGGRRLRILADESSSPAGPHSFPLRDRRDGGPALEPGIYFYRVHTVDGVAQGRFLVMK